jgi:hypothetical protein
VGAAVGSRGDAGRPVECRGEGARFTVAQGQSDIRHRRGASRQQKLGVFDATAVVIAARRQAERLLEGPAEIVRTQADQPREGRQRYRLGQMLFDVGRGRALLPGGKSAFRRSFDAWRSGGDANELKRQDGAERFEVGTAVGTWALDQALELERRVNTAASSKNSRGLKGAGSPSDCDGIAAGSK